MIKKWIIIGSTELFYKMSPHPYFFPLCEKPVNFLADWVNTRNWGVNKLSYFNLFLGFAAPLPLVFHIYFPSSLLMIFSPIFFCAYVLLDYTIANLEIVSHRRSAINTFLPFPPAVLIFMWYEVVLCEVTYVYSGLGFIRYLNVFVLCCAVAAILLIYGYLKLQGEPLNIHRFTEQLEFFGKENEKEAPFNYITLTFKVVKRDLLAAMLFILSLLNLYLLYTAAALAAVGFFGFTVYSLVLMKLMKSDAINQAEARRDSDPIIDTKDEDTALGV